MRPEQVIAALRFDPLLPVWLIAAVAAAAATVCAIALWRRARCSLLRVLPRRPDRPHPPPAPADATVCAIALWRRARASPLRVLAFATLILWLAGPRLVRETDRKSTRLNSTHIPLS